MMVNQWKLQTIRVIATVVSLLVFVAGVGSPAAGQTSSTSTTLRSGPPGQGAAIRISPALLSYSVNPGATFEASVNIGNISGSPMAIRAIAAEYVPEEAVDPSSRYAYDASGWIRIGAPDFLLLPGETRPVTLQFTVPQNVEPGSHYATTYFEAFVPDQANLAQGTTVNARVGAVITLNVSGEANRKVELSSPLATSPVQWTAGPTEFTFRLHNAGNVHLNPKGSIVVKDMFGRKAATLPVLFNDRPAQEQLLLPGTQREYRVTWEHGPLVGRYSAEAEVFVGDEAVEGSLSQSFWLLPWISLLIFSLGVFVVVYLATIPVRRRRRRARARKRALAVLSGETKRRWRKSGESKQESDAGDELPPSESEST
jgi:hypothetical protein